MGLLALYIPIAHKLLAKWAKRTQERLERQGMTALLAGTLAWRRTYFSYFGFLALLQVGLFLTIRPWFRRIGLGSRWIDGLSLALLAFVLFLVPSR
jgi:hypothetical protein